MDANSRIALLVALVLQNSLSALLGRATRTAAKPEDLYNINHFITISECGKFVLSLLLECYMQGGVSGLSKSIQTHVLNNVHDAVRGSLIPAFLYLVSNTLLYVALSNLSAPVFQVLCQLKLITTAVMSVVLLKRTYSKKQWLCIFILCAGVATVITGEQRQHALRNVSTQSSSSNNDNSSSKNKNSDFPNAIVQVDPTRNIFIGLTTVGISCLFSSLAGVYFELILKHKAEAAVAPVESTAAGDSSDLKTSSPSTIAASIPVNNAPSLWIRNMMLALFSLIIGMMQGMIQKGSMNENKPYLHGFHVMVWVQVLLLSCGGLLVAGVIKYADNVIKGLATGISVVLSSSLSVVFLGDEPTMSFFVGVTFIITSVYYFSNEFKVPTTRQTSMALLMFLLLVPIVFLEVSFPKPPTSSPGIRSGNFLTGDNSDNKVTIHTMPMISNSANVSNATTVLY